MADAGSRPEAAAEHHDVLIVGAGLSGIGAAHHLKTDSPGRSFLILESREGMGGTWDLFRYPGIRSDSDMYTLGYSFRPWTDRKAIADGPSILRYIQDTARDGGIQPHIRYAHHVTRASWSSETARWTVDAQHAGQTVRLTCNWLHMCSGYYDYEAGHSPDFPGLADYRGRVVHPQFWPDDLDHKGRRVAVIGSGIAEAVFDGADPLGRNLSVGGVRFRVIGVFAEVGASLGADRDDEVHIPVTAAQRLFGDVRIDALALKAPSTDDIEQTRRAALAVLADRYPDEEFSAVTQDQVLGTVGRILGLLTTVLAAIAAISLLVGGVGVSNIMLVSVRERTREIGLRKAVGARTRDITLQFLLEAVLLTTIGGVIGIALGVGGSLGLAADVDQLPAVVTWWSPVLAFTVSAAVGIFFGVVPARRAGRLDPVVALRTE